MDDILCSLRLIVVGRVVWVWMMGDKDPWTEEKGSFSPSLPPVRRLCGSACLGPSPLAQGACLAGRPPLT